MTVKKKSPNSGHWMFRLRSGRGTDVVTCVKLPEGTTKTQAKAIVDQWADDIVRNSAITDCVVSFRRVRISNRPMLLKQWDALCKRRERLDTAWKEHRAKLNPVDWRKL